jgi:hypothetical protein
VQGLYKSKFVESLFKWIGRYVGHIFENSIIMCEIHLVEKYPYFLMWYTSQFVYKAMPIHMHDLTNLEHLEWSLFYF